MADLSDGRSNMSKQLATVPRVTAATEDPINLALGASVAGSVAAFDGAAGLASVN